MSAATGRWMPALAAGAAWCGPALLALAVLAALALPGHPAGLGLALAGAGTGALVAAATGARDRFALGCWLGALLLALVPAVRDAGWVVAVALFAALGLAAVAGASGRTWGALGGAVGRGATGLVPGPAVVLALVARRAAGRRWSRLAPVARGLLLAGLLLLVFVPLLTAADAAFAALLGDLFAWDLALDRPWARVGVALLVLAVGGALLAAHARPAPAADAGPPRRRLGRVEWAIALVALDVTLATFVAVQAAVLFGGHDLILRTDGLTYAEHARRGFFELEAVAALTLGVVAATARWARREGAGDERLARLLLGLLCALTLVVLASALQRLWLYVDAFGATRAALPGPGAAALARGGVRRAARGRRAAGRAAPPARDRRALRARGAALRRLGPGPPDRGAQRRPLGGDGAPRRPPRERAERRRRAGARRAPGRAGGVRDRGRPRRARVTRRRGGRQPRARRRPRCAGGPRRRCRW